MELSDGLSRSHYLVDINVEAHFYINGGMCRVCSAYRANVSLPRSVLPL